MESVGSYKALCFIPPSKSIAALQLMKREADQMDLSFFPLLLFFIIINFFTQLIL